MGIKRLYNYLRYVFEECDLSVLSGKTVGIDAMGWLYQAYFCQCDLEAEVKLGIVRNMERKISLLEKNNIKFIFVIDGLNLPCKESTLKKRENKRLKFLQKSVKMEKEKYDIGESSVFKKYSESISKEIIYFFIDYLKHKGMEYIVAPYEADSQLNHLYQNDIIDYIMSEDSDIAGYGCNHIIKNVLKNGTCKIINSDIISKFPKKLKKNTQDPEYAKMEKAFKFFELDKQDKILVSIYSGCDYLENIKGVGFGTLIGYFPEHKDELKKKIEKAIKRDKKHGILPAEVSNEQEYFEKIELVNESFTNQIVYCKKTNKFVSLNNNNNLKKEKKIIDYTGDLKTFKNFEPKKYSQGFYDFVTHKQRIVEEYNFDMTIKFIKTKTDPYSGLLNNLSTKTFTFAEFQNSGEDDEMTKKRKNLEESFTGCDLKKKSKKFMIVKE